MANIGWFQVLKFAALHSLGLGCKSNMLGFWNEVRTKKAYF